ncbi:MAG: HAMP domain-containing sensor histidine kinase [Eubacteriales bacterium]|nr:HAMP domain-containing sensor histidine kinase [Eubacteriales bacterium]
MKKISLSFQITLVFLTAFILTSVLLGILITSRLDDVFVNNVYESLEADGRAMKQTSDISNFELSEGNALIRYYSDDKAYDASGNILEYLDDDSIKLIINKAALQETGSERYVNSINGKVIYYVVLNYGGFFNVQREDILIVLTDSQIKNAMVRETASQILLASLIAFVLGYLVILLWATRLVRDTKRISGTLDMIGDNHYLTKITSKRRDEIGDLASSIEAMRAKIIGNEKQKQEIIQGVSHDLKTPIAVIQSYAEALNDGVCAPKDVASITTRECERLNDKVTKLLQMTRLNYIEIGVRTPGSTKMHKLVSEIVSDYSYQTQALIETDLTETAFDGDEESWRIVLGNLLDNAVRYAKAKIRLTLKESGLAVYNDGSHINKDQLSSIFDAYEKGVDGKFGLGLSIVKRTAELFGYKVAAENLDDGVEFRIYR